MRQFSKWLLLTMLLVLTAASGGIAWLCYSRAGLEFALQRLNQLPGIHVEVSGVTGRLAGPLHIDHLVLDHERVHIEVRQMDMDLNTAPLLSGLIAIDELRLGQVVVQYKAQVTPKPDKPIYFLPALLRLQVAQLIVQQGEYRHSNGYVLYVTPSSAQVSMSRRQMTLTHLQVQTRDFDVQGEATLLSRQVLDLTAKGQAQYRVANGVVLRGAVQAQGPVTGAERRLNLSAQLTAPHELKGQGQLTFVNGNWQIDGTAQGEQVHLDAWWQQPSFYLQAVQGRYRLNAQGMHYEIDANIPTWTSARLHLDADTRYAQRVFYLDRADVSVPSTGVTTRTIGRIRIGGKQPELDLRSTWRALRWPLHASQASATLYSTQGEITLQGAMPYRYDLRAALTHGSWPGATLIGTGSMTTGVDALWRFDRYQLQTLKGMASGQASITLKRPYRYALQVDATRINPAELVGRLPGSINLIGSVQGVVDEQAQSIELRLDHLSGQLRDHSVQGHGRLAWQRNEAGRRRTVDWFARDVLLQWGRNQLTANGQWHDGKAQRQQLSVRVQAPDISQLDPDWRGDVHAQLDYQADQVASGERRTWRVTGNSNQLNWGPLQSEQLNVEAYVDDADVAPSSLTLRAQRLGSKTASAFGLQNVLLSGRGYLRDHELQLTATPSSDVLPEDLQLQASLHGDYRDARWQAVLTPFTVTNPQGETLVTSEQPMNLSVSTQAATLSPTCWRIQDGRLCLQAQAQTPTQTNTATAKPTTWSINAQAQQVPIVIRSRRLAPTARLQARWQAALNMASNNGEPWTGQVTSQFTDATIRYVVNGRERSLPVHKADLAVTAYAGHLDVDSELRAGAETITVVHGRVERVHQPLAQWPVSGVLAINSSDAKLIPVFFSDVDRANGTIAAALQFSGALSNPRLTGHLRLLDGELDFYQANLALRGLQLEAHWANESIGDRLTFTATSRTGVKGDQGQLQAQGNLLWAQEQLTGRLNVTGERLLVADVPEYRVLATPNLNFDIRGRNIKVDGEVLIPEARLQPKDVSAAVKTSSDTRYVDDTTIDTGTQYHITSDIRVRMGEAVQFNGLGLQGRLAGSVLTHTRTGSTASGDGELSVVDGHYEAYARKLDIKRGRLLYNGTALGDPGLDIQAERNIEDPSLGNLTVGVYVRGVLRAPRFQFYSDPEMNQTQIVSYLLVGKPLDSLQSQDASTVRSASNTLALQGGGYLAGQLGRRIGLEEVGVETDANNQSSLVLGKFLSPRLFISYGISLTEAINTVKLRYSLGRHWQLKAEAGAAKSADLEFRIEH